MDRSFFRRPSRDSSPLLPQHSSSKSYPLADLPPRPYSDSPSPSQRSQASSSPLATSHRPHVQFSYPPPPIVSSLLLSPPLPSTSRSISPSFSPSQKAPSISGATNPLTTLSRREKAIQSELQLLLNAQSAGLVQGRTGDQHGDDRSSDAGSSTPTSRSMALSPTRSNDESNRSRTRGVIPVRQPRTKKISLNSARKGILSAMEELSDVKQHEEVIIEGEMHTLQSFLEQVGLWENKIALFDREMKRITDGSEGREIAELKTERSVVETEIRELEDRLLSLRAREQYLARRIEEVGNRKDAEISSFREGKREVENEVKDFLRRPPVLAVATTVATRTKMGGDEREGIETFIALPPKRRTLDMAKDYLSASLTTLTTHLSATTTEKEALHQGARVWSQTIGAITAFELALRAQIQEGKQLEIRDLKSQLAKMDTLVLDLEAKAAEAGKKGWNLLICAIGAELEAFKEGRGLLEGVLQRLNPASGRAAEDLDLNLGSHEHDTEEGLLKNGHASQDDQDHDDPGSKFLGQSRSALADMGGLLLDEGDPGQDIQKGEDRGRELSPYRSETESEDDGPPKALLVGVEDEDDT